MNNISLFIAESGISYALFLTGLAIVFFFVINWFGKHLATNGYMSLSLFYKADEAPIFNNLFRMVAPPVLLLVTSAFLANVGLKHLVVNIWLTVPLMFVLRTVYNLLTQRGALINWKQYLFNALFSILISYWLHKSLILNNLYLFPDMQSFANEFWLLVILFIYQTFNSISFNSSGSLIRKDAYIDDKFNYLKKHFSHVIKERVSIKELEILCHSIIIVEMFNRSRIHRTFERLFCFITKVETSTGIMQVKNKSPLSDLDSVIKGVELLNTEYQKVQLASKGQNPDYFEEGSDHYIERLLARTTWFFNRSDEYVEDVMRAYGIIKNKYYSKPKKEKDIYNAFSNYNNE